jgi:hypothetical protein
VAAIKKQATDWFMFDEMTRRGKVALLKGVSAVNSITVALMAGPISDVPPAITMGNYTV